MPSRPSRRAAPRGATANLATFAAEPPRELELHYGRNQLGILLWEVPGTALPDGRADEQPDPGRGVDHAHQ